LHDPHQFRAGRFSGTHRRPLSAGRRLLAAAHGPSPPSSEQRERREPLPPFPSHAQPDHQAPQADGSPNASEKNASNVSLMVCFRSRAASRNASATSAAVALPPFLALAARSSMA